MDASASLGLDNFVKTKQFIKTIASAFDVSPANTHVSVVTYSERTNIEFDFTRYTNRRDLFNAVDNIPYRRGRLTYIDEALITADKQVFTPANKARTNAFRVSINCVLFVCLSPFQQHSSPGGGGVHDLRMDGGLLPGFQKATIF